MSEEIIYDLLQRFAAARIEVAKFEENDDEEEVDHVLSSQEMRVALAVLERRDRENWSNTKGSYNVINVFCSRLSETFPAKNTRLNSFFQ